jgi:acyl carrier protein
MTADAALAIIKEVLEMQFGVPPQKITREATFRGKLALDSLDTINLIQSLEKRFGLSEGLEAYAELHTVGMLVDFVVSHA